MTATLSATRKVFEEKPLLVIADCSLEQDYDGILDTVVSGQSILGSTLRYVLYLEQVRMYLQNETLETIPLLI